MSIYCAMSRMRILHYRGQMEQEQVLNNDRGKPMTSWVFKNLSVHGCMGVGIIKCDYLLISATATMTK